MTVIGHGYDDNVGAPAFRNVIINGGMSVAQRNTSVASITTGNYYTADRWNIATDGTAGTWTQSVENDAPTGSGLRKSLKMLCTVVRSSLSANDALVFEQKIEGQNIQHLAKGTSSTKSITISFWVKSNVTGTYAVRLRDDTNSRHICATYVISASATWEKKTITFTGDTTGVINNDNASGLTVQFWLLAGSTYSGGALATSWAAVSNANCAVGQVNLAATLNNYWQITGVQLEAGSVATPFEFEPYETTLRKCQRYFVRYSWVANDYVGVGMCRTGNYVTWNHTLPVPMRTKPTSLTFGGTWAVMDASITGRGLSSLSMNTSSILDVNCLGAGFNLVAGNAGTIFASTAITLDTNGTEL